MSARKTRERLAFRLSALGLEVQPGSLWCVEGGERQVDGARWGGNVKARPPLAIAFLGGAVRPYLYSWDTMTDCLRLGFDLAFFGLFQSSYEIEAHARRGPGGAR